MGKFKLNTDIADDLKTIEDVTELKTSGYVKKGYNPKSLKNIGPREAGSVQPKAYMQLNIYDYEDYIYRMAKVQGKTMTAYVLDLIQKDKEQNQQAYEGLKLIKELDKPARKPKNTKKIEN